LKEEDSVKKSNKLTAAVTASVVASTLVAPAAFAASTDFTDIGNSYAKDAINELVEAGILNGVGNGQFNPTGKITRQDFAIILAKALKLDTTEAPANPTFSDVPASHYSYKFVEAAVKAELIAGVGGGNFGLNANLTRQDMAVLFVRALGVETEGLGEKLTFADADKIAGYAKDAVGYVVEAGLMNGMPGNTFAPTGLADRQQVALVTSNFLKHNPDKQDELKVTTATLVDDTTITVNFNKEAEAVAKEDIKVAVKGTGAAVAVESVALSEDKKSATVKVAKLPAGTTFEVSYKGTKSAEVNTPVATQLQVTDVVAVNLKQIEVKFNKEVDATEGVKLANYFVGKEGATAVNVADQTGAKVVLSADGKTAIITLEDGAALGNYTTANKVTVSKSVGLTEDYSKTNVSVSDTVSAAFASVAATGPREITISFSEPINRGVAAGLTVSSFLLDNGAIALDPSSAVYSDADKTLKIKTYADLTEGAHTLKLKSGAANQLLDYNGSSVVPFEQGFTFTKDTTAPTVTVKSSNERSVTLKFSKAVTNVNTANVIFSHSYQGHNQVAGNAAGVVTAGGADEYTITFANPLPPGTSTIYVDYVANTTDANKIKDNYGNVLAPIALQVNTSADVTKPEASAVEFVSSSQVKVTFSEAVLAGSSTDGAENPANYTLKDAAGNAIQVTSAIFDVVGGVTSNKTVVLTTAADAIQGGTYTVEVKNVKDRSVAANKLETVTKSFTATDKVAPKLADLNTAGGTAADSLLLSAKKVRIGFSEPMNKASIENKDNYFFEGAALPAGTTVTASADLKSVVVDFTNANPAVTPLSGDEFSVGRVEDQAGNKTVAMTTTVTISALVNPTAAKVEAVGKNQVKLTFNEALSGVLASDFAVNPGTGFETPASISVTTEGGKTYVTLYTQNAMTTNGTPVVRTTANSTLAVTQAAATGAVNEFGTAININDVTGVDAIAPELITTDAVATQDVDADGFIDHVLVTFSENMNQATIDASSFKVEGYTVTGVTTDTDGVVATAVANGDMAASQYVLLTVVEKTTGPSDVTVKPSVTVGSIKDTAGNAFVSKTVTASDKVAPVATLVSNATVTAAEATAGFNVVATSSKLGKLYVVPTGTYANETALLAADIATATVTVAGANTTVAVPAAAATAGAYQVYAVDANGNISAALSFTVAP